MTDWNAVLVGTVYEIAAIGASSTITLLADRAYLGAVVLLSLGLFGGVTAGGLIDGSWWSGAYHGAIAGGIGGVAFALLLWYAMVTPNALGAFYGLTYVIATIGIPPDFAARYNAVLPPAFGILGIILFAIEGAVAGAAVPRELITPPPFYPD
jgi:hypothetical protein